MKARLISEILSGIWLIDPVKANGYLPLVASIIRGDFNIEETDLDEARKSSQPYLMAPNNSGVYEVSEYGFNSPPESAPKNSIAMIPVLGVVTKYDQFCGPSGTNTKSDLLSRCENNPNINAIILRIDGPGGEGAGTQSFVNSIRNCSKPVIGFVEDIAASADYWIASACESIIANVKSTEVGSIGAYSTVVDYDEFWRMQGINVIDIYAKQSSDKNKPYLDALAGKPEQLQEEVSAFAQLFIDDVKSFRGNKIDMSKGDPFTGKMYFTKDALEVGLIDEVGNFDQAVQRAIDLTTNNSNNSKNTDMKFKNAWNSILSSLGMTASEKEEDNPAVEENHMEKLNSELASKSKVIEDVAALFGEEAEKEDFNLLNAVQHLQTTNTELTGEVAVLTEKVKTTTLDNEGDSFEENVDPEFKDEPIKTNVHEDSFLRMSAENNEE